MKRGKVANVAGASSSGAEANVAGASSSGAEALEQDAPATLTPKLRFPEFRDGPGWTIEKLEVVVLLITERVGNKECIPMSVTSGAGLVSQQEKFGRTIAGNQFKNYLVLRKNDFAYNKSATKEFPQGFIARYLGDEPGAVPNSIFTCFRADESRVVPDFLDYQFLGNLHGRWLKKYIEVSARAHGSLSISDEDLLALPVPLPSSNASLAEQQKIAECLSTLDELIGAESQKLDALKAYKKGLMQQLFPREGENLPRLRFPEFQNAPEWLQANLGNIVDFESGGTPSKQNTAFWNGCIPWVTAKDMKQPFLADTEQHITTAAAEGGAKQVPAGTVLVLTRGMTLFKDVPICLLRRPMSFNQDVKALRVKEEISADFLLYLLLANKQRILAMVDSAGHGTGRLSTDELRSLDVSFPHREEQQQIADCLLSIDSGIPYQNDKIETLKTHKRGLMQQLFPASQ
jgi:type I restriction enzyme S subunit